MDDESREQWALWKLGVLGPLMSARLEHGDVCAYLRAAAARVHRAPDGRDTVVSARTIEGWHYDYRRGGLSALLPKEREDKGQSRAIRTELADLLLRAKAENPRRSLRRLIKMMVRAKAAEPNELSRSSVHRLLKTAGLSWRPGRAEIQERRAFLVEHASDLVICGWATRCTGRSWCSRTASCARVTCSRSWTARRASPCTATLR